MKLTKRLEAEILEVMEDYWSSYLNGDLQRWASYLPDDYRNIGTTKEEIWNNKKEIVDYTNRVIDQMVGMAETRNKKTQFIPYDPYVMVHELGDLYVKAGESWIYYAQFRMSSLLEKTADGWKILHQHGSFPDSKADEGEAFGFDELKVENKKLRDAIQSRTMELERKNRELEIEAALERVRAASMSMHTPDELKRVGEIIFAELKSLGFANLRNTEIIINNDKKESVLSHYYSDYGVSGSIEVFYDDHPVVKDWAQDMKKASHAFAEVVISEDEIDAWKKYREEIGYLPDPKLDTAKSLYYYSYSTGLGALSVSSFTPITEEQLNMLARFRNVFGLAYRRYVDVALAEAQAREAQIEAALEKVRSRTMAMHSSTELADVAALLFQQVKELGVETYSSGFNIWDKEHKEMISWMSNPEGSLNPPFKMPILAYEENRRLYTSWKEEDDFYVDDIVGEDLQRHYKFLRSFPLLDEAFKKAEAVGIKTPDRQVHNIANFSHGNLLFITLQRCPEYHDIFKRFAKVFDQTYTRFLELKKAEAQAREAQIELSLERIRAQATAMKESSDLLDIVVTMRHEFVSLGHEAHYFWHMRWLPDRYEKAMTSGDGSRIGMVMTLPRHIHGDIEPVADWERSDEPTYVLAMDTETAVDYVDKMITLGDFEQVDPQAPSLDDIRHIGGLTFVMARTTHGEIGFSLPGVVPDPPKDTVDTLVRFAGVFDLAYKRFEDLQKAEARAREAEQQASLDRVRAEIASMRTTGDLQRITPLIWRELTTLGVPFFRCGIFIIEEAAEQAHVYLSTPAGEAVAALHLKFDSAPVIQAAVQHWRQQQVYREEWNREQFIAWTQSLVVQRQIDSPEKYQAGGEAPEKLALHFLPFTQGMLYIGSHAALSDDEIEIGQALANAFGVAYARYEDFQRLEAAKAEVEVALENLKKTQGQLIQAEKMASLGQLTAGIAHEIRNPLNFVNNFATLSMKVLQELAGLVEKQKERIEAGDAEEIDEEIGRLRELNKKINEHGKRAGNIVSSMMEHARSGKGERTATDINLLLDESANLVYHGMRATDPSFNVTIEKEYDESIGKLKIVPQDISRVFLNLVNNACYAAFQKQKANGKEKKTNDGSTELAEVKEQKASGDSFSPTISLSTKNLRDRIEIRIRDNGNGIPKDIREKIFNPFFTTKPTGQGTGLGLSISYDIVVQEHEGEIRVETEDGKFTEFVVRLPRNG